MWGILIEKNYVFVVSKGISVTTIVITMLIAIDIFDIQKMDKAGASKAIETLTKLVTKGGDSRGLVLGE